MHTNLMFHRWLIAGLLATTTLSVATPALAARRYKRVVHTPPVQRVVVHERSSSVGPVLAGMVGGFLLGAAITSGAQPVVVHERVYRRPVVVYRYFDPYENLWFDSLDQCEFRGHGYHPRIIHVIDTGSGRHVRTLRYHKGRWHRWDGGHGWHD